MLIKESKKNENLIKISILMLVLSLFILNSKSFQLIHIETNENNINYQHFEYLNLEISGTIIEDPIFINGSATGVEAHNWAWAEDQDWCTGTGSLNDPYVIENLSIDGNNQTTCIEIHNSDKVLIIRNCTVFNSRSESDPGAGIWLENVTNSILSNNECFENAYGIFMEQCSYNTITENTASNNAWAGIHIFQCINNTISNNIANNNVGVEFESIGICLWLCDFNNVSENVANYNKYGIWLSSQVTIWGSHNNTISNNTASYNEVVIVLYGILGRCYDNLVSGNIVSNNLNYGIRVSRSPQNIFCKNTIEDNENDGIYLYKESHNNTISENIIKNNGQIGLKIGNQSYWNLIYYNCFIGNNLNAQDDGTENEWDNGISGNYWDNYTGSDTDDDGIGETPYDVPPVGGSVDNFPLMKCPYSPPQEGRGIPFVLIILISSIGGGAVIVVVTILLIRLKKK